VIKITDEGYKCSVCGQENCRGDTEFRCGDKWYKEFDCPEDCPSEEERWVCGETGKVGRLILVWSTEDK
jgi:hypothetical protein